MDQYSSSIDAAFDPEDELLGLSSSQPCEGGAGSDHAVRTGPVFTKAALNIIGERVLPQRTLYGSVLAQCAPGFPELLAARDAKLYMNTNAPFSGVVCGVQGSGKSHSTAVLLEGCLMKDPRIGTLPAPLTGLVFHFDTAAGGGAVQPCEAAYLASLDPVRAGSATAPSVTVLVVPNNLHRMREVYSALPHVNVAPLHFAAEDISGDRLLAMMKVETDTQMPLYMEVIMNILRSMDIFDYPAFRAKLDEESRCFAPNQKSMMALRLNLLDACLKGGNMINRVSSQFKPGHLTIIDLSSPFMDACSACSFFDIILGLFIEHRPKTNGVISAPPPKLVVLDEAHKYLTENGSSSRLTESLLSIIRQQRHENMRVLISTQEPTVVPSKFLDLCSFIIAHRFSSPQWLRHLSKHVAAAESLSDSWASKVVSLQTGEAMFFAPAGLAVKDHEGMLEDARNQTVAPMGQGYFLVRSRLRLTQDGGQSHMATDSNHEAHTEGESTPVSGLGSPRSASSFGTMNSGSSASSSSSDTFATAEASRSAAPPNTTVQTSDGPPVGSSVTPAVSTPPVALWQDAKPVPTKYDGLVRFLQQRSVQGQPWARLDEIGQHRAKNRRLYNQLPVKLLNGVETAVLEGFLVRRDRFSDYYSVHPDYEL